MSHKDGSHYIHKLLTRHIVLIWKKLFFTKTFKYPPPRYVEEFQNANFCSYSGAQILMVTIAVRQRFV